MSILFHEGLKLIKDKQVRAVVFVLYFYTIFGFLTSVNLEIFYNTTPEVFLKNNSDSVVSFILMGFISSSIFGSDFSYRTYKNIIPFAGRRRIFVNKLIALLISAASILLIDFILNIVIAFFMTGKMAGVLDAIALFKRYVAFYIIVLFISAFLILFCILTRSRALTYVMAVVLPFSFSAFPIGYKNYTVWDIFEEMYTWNMSPLNTNTVLLSIVILIVLLTAGIIFSRREVLL